MWFPYQAIDAAWLRASVEIKSLSHRTKREPGALSLYIARSLGRCPREIDLVCYLWENRARVLARASYVPATWPDASLVHTASILCATGVRSGLATRLHPHVSMALTLIRRDAVLSLTDVFSSFLHLPRCKIAFSGLYVKKKKVKCKSLLTWLSLGCVILTCLGGYLFRCI